MEQFLQRTFKPIKRDEYLEQVHSVAMNFKSLHVNGLISMNPEKQMPIKQIFFQKKNSTQLYFQTQTIVPLPQSSQLILFFKQNYECIFKAKQHKSTPFFLKQILIKFYTQQFNWSKHSSFNSLSNNDSEEAISQESPLSIHIEPSMISLYRYNESRIVSEFKSDPILPQNPEKDWSMLERRIWIEVNKKINMVSVHTGDVQDIENSKTVKLSEPLVSSIEENDFDWKNCEKSYCDMKNSSQKSSQNAQVNPLLRLTHFKVFLKTQTLSSSNLKEPKRIINPFDYMTIKCLKIQTNKRPRLKQTPSILQPQVVDLTSMPHELKSLYSRLKGLDLLSLFKADQKQAGGHQSLSEEMIGSSIHHSLVTQFQLVGDDKIPIGILNHVLKMKTDQEFIEFTRKENSNKSPKQLYLDVIQKRVGYIRFKIFNPEGMYPGSPAIMEIWPPYYSSPIHNHGQAFGLSKVLMGQTRIENFQDLSIQTQKEPYLKSDLKKGEYSWLSQNSFGIHRVINLHPQTAISLQGYFDHKQGLDEYFSFIENDPKNKQKSFAVYYPQHDWQNYLNKRSIKSPEDRAFIDRVIEHYDLKDKESGKMNVSFGKFIKVLIEEYDLMKQLIDRF